MVKRLALLACLLSCAGAFAQTDGPTVPAVPSGLSATASLGAAGMLGGGEPIVEPRINVGLGWKVRDALWLSLSGGYTSFGASSLTISSGSAEIGAEWHPRADPFFVRGGVGYEALGVQLNLNLGSVSPTGGPVPAIISMRSIYFTPTVGWLWVKPSGFMIGFDVGFQIPLAPWGGITITQTTSADADEVANLASASQDVLGYLSSKILPKFTLIRVGWMF